MATITDFVLSSIQKIRNGDVKNNRPNSEAVMSKLGSNINYLIDRNFFDEDFTYNGYFNANSVDNGVGGIKRIMFDSEITSYQFSMRLTGSSGNNIINAEVRDENGSLVGNLFGSGTDRLLMPANSGTNVIIGKDVETNTNFANNIGVATPQYGELAITTLLEGYMIIPFIEGNGNGALNANLKLRMRGV